MPNLNPLLSGDVAYPQYSVTITQEIEAGVTILKGVIYTKNATGNLAASTGDLTKGIYQARATPTVNVPALAGDTVQVLGPRTRMLLVDSAGGLVEGDNVDNTTNTDEVVMQQIQLVLHMLAEFLKFILKMQTEQNKKFHKQVTW